MNVLIYVRECVVVNQLACVFDVCTWWFDWVVLNSSEIYSFIIVPQQD